MLCGNLQEARAAAEQEAAEVKQRLASAQEAAARQAVEKDAEAAARDARALQEKTREVAALRSQHDACDNPLPDLVCLLAFEFLSDISPSCFMTVS